MQGPGWHETIASLMMDASVRHTSYKLEKEYLLFHLFEIET